MNNVVRLPARLRVVEPMRFGDYRDHLRRPNAPTAAFKPIERTEKQPGDLIVTSIDIVRQP